MVLKNTTCPRAIFPWLQSHGLERSAGNKEFNINLLAPSLKPNLQAVQSGLINQFPVMIVEALPVYLAPSKCL